MFLLDSNILSPFALVDRLDLLFAGFRRATLHLSGNVETELRPARPEHAHLERVLRLIDQPPPGMRLEVVRAGPAEIALYGQIPWHPQGHVRLRAVGDDPGRGGNLPPDRGPG